MTTESKIKSYQEKGYRRVLILYTGGTIGMKMSPKGYVPVANYFGGMLKSLPQFYDVSEEVPDGISFACTL